MRLNLSLQYGCSDCRRQRQRFLNVAQQCAVRDPECICDPGFGIRAGCDAAVFAIRVERILVEGVRIERRTRKSRGGEMTVKCAAIPVNPAQQQVVRMDVRGMRHTLKVQSG